MGSAQRRRSQEIRIPCQHGSGTEASPIDHPLREEPAERSLRVLVLDPCPLWRLGLQQLLAGARDLDLAGVAGDAVGGERLCCELKPDLLVLGPFFPFTAAFNLLARLRGQHPLLHVLIVSHGADSAALCTLLATDSISCALAEDALEALRDALRVAGRGETWYSPRVLALLTAHLRVGAALSLTERERQVARLLGAGLEDREIGKALGLSQRSVRSYVTQIRGKLGGFSRYQVIAWAARQWWDGPDAICGRKK